jgi:hypothetical protein
VLFPGDHSVTSHPVHGADILFSLSPSLLVSQSPPLPLSPSPLDWIQSHEILLGWLSAVSVVMFFGSISAIPWLVVRIPADYFLRQRHYADRWRPRHPLLRIAFLVVKNLIGVLLLVAGAVMLITPGQGILTILVGLLFLDLPGKFALERRVVQIRPVRKAVAWMRAKAGRPPLELPEDHDRVL